VKPHRKFQLEARMPPSFRVGHDHDSDFRRPIEGVQ
jgi:hypothetical protein